LTGKSLLKVNFQKRISCPSKAALRAEQNYSQANNHLAKNSLVAKPN
jgi:hypothetical protein